jgi:sulfite oxidase
VALAGWAVAGGRAIVRVDVSGDDGASWTAAELLEDLGPWAWRRWRAELELGPGQHVLRARAWDAAAQTQPESAATVWNPKGYVNTAQPRVTVRLA